MKNRFMGAMIKTLTAACVSLSAATASAEPECVVGDEGAFVGTGSTYCEVTAFGDSYAYRLDLRARQLGGGYGEVRVTRVSYVPGSGNIYDCDFSHAAVEVTAGVQANGEVQEDRVDPATTLSCGEPITMVARDGESFTGASCKVIYGCQ